MRYMLVGFGVLACWALSEYLIEQDQMRIAHQHLAKAERAAQIKLVNLPASGEPDTLEVDTAAKPVVLYRESPKHSGQKKTASYRPKSEAERLAIIKHLWRLDSGNYEIGSLK